MVPCFDQELALCTGLDPHYADGCDGFQGVYTLKCNDGSFQRWYLTPPVLTDYLELSVGGTLIVGGVGGTISRDGLQSDNVLALNVVTGQGEQVTCSPQRNADLFHAVRAGLGQVGVITRATLALMPAPTQVRRYELFYAELKGLLTDERLLSADDRFAVVQGAALLTPDGWKYKVDAMSPFAGDNPPASKGPYTKTRN